MLLIPCPWCGPRDENEFTCGGEAHIARPTNGEQLTDAEWARVPVHAQEPEGRALRALDACHGCRRWFNVARDTVTHEIYAVYKMGEPAPQIDRRERPMSQVNRLPQGGRIDRSKPLRFTFNGKRLPGLRGRHAGLGAARQRRGAGRPQLQVSPPARHPRPPAPKSRTRWSSSGQGNRTEPNLRATQIELYDGLVAESQNRWPQPRPPMSARSTACSTASSRPASTTRPSCGRRASG